MSSKLEESDWTPCAEGDLSLTIKRVRNKRLQANLLRMGASTFAATLVFVAASIYFSPKSAELECRHVAGLLAEYASGDLDQESRRVVEEHLVSCEKCRIKLGEFRLTAWATPRDSHVSERGPLGSRLNDLVAMPLSINR